MFKPVQLGDVLMIERGERPCFALEPGDELGIAGERRGKDFQRHVATELRVARAIDFAHPAGAENTDDGVAADSGAARQTHARAAIIATR